MACSTNPFGFMFQDDAPDILVPEEHTQRVLDLLQKVGIASKVKTKRIFHSQSYYWDLLSLPGGTTEQDVYDALGDDWDSRNRKPK